MLFTKIHTTSYIFFRQMHPRALFFVYLSLMTAFILVSCHEDPNREEGSDTAANNGNSKSTDLSQDQESHFRIVSLSPAITDILIDLELQTFIVGRGAWDEQLSNRIPRVGDLFNLNLEQLIMLEPSDIIIQAGSRGIPQLLQDHAAQHGWTIINAQIDSLSDIELCIDQLVTELTFHDNPDLQKATKDIAKHIIADMGASLQSVGDTDLENTGTVLLLHATNPPAAFGPGSYLDNILTKLGGTNALATGSPWQQLDSERLLVMQPDSIILIQPGPVDKTGIATTLGDLDQLPLDAIRANRCRILSHPQALLPSTSVIEIAGLLRELLIDLDEHTAADRDTQG